VPQNLCQKPWIVLCRICKSTILTFTLYVPLPSLLTNSICLALKFKLFGKLFHNFSSFIAIDALAK